MKDIKLICKNKKCGKEFYVSPWQIKDGRKYCSKECFRLINTKAVLLKVGFKNNHKYYPPKDRELANKRLSNSLKGVKKSRKAIEKSRIGLIRGYASKRLKVWNKGETKESSPSIRIASKKISKANKKYYKKGGFPWNKGLYVIPSKTYGSGFRNPIKNFIRKAYNFKCQLCSKRQTEFNECLHIHHIDYDKRNNNRVNLIPLCRSCHMKTNSYRDKWQSILERKVIFKPYRVLDMEKR